MADIGEAREAIGMAGLPERASRIELDIAADGLQLARGEGKHEPETALPMKRGQAPEPPMIRGQAPEPPMIRGRQSPRGNSGHSMGGVRGRQSPRGHCSSRFAFGNP